MKKEVFDIEFVYQGIILKAVIKTTKVPVGPGNQPYEVWINGKYQFTIEPGLNEFNSPYWKLVPMAGEKKIDSQMIFTIGEAIKGHYQ